MVLESDAFQALNDEYPCRELQIQQLSQLFSPTVPSPSTLILHGLENTCKTTLTARVLELSGTAHAIISSDECITGRHLLERTVAACIDAIERASASDLSELVDDTVQIDRSRYARCENLAALVVHLERLLVYDGAEAGIQKFVLVFDGIGKQREAPNTLLPGLARLGEIIPNLTIVFIVTFPRHGLLHISGTPHIRFPCYTRDEAIRIVSRNPLPIFPATHSSSPLESGYTDIEQAEDSAWLWPRFCAAVWDSLAKNFARDVIAFRELAERLWRPFVQPIADYTLGTRDFSKLVVRGRAVLQDEKALVESVIDTTAIGTSTERKKDGVGKTEHQRLTYYAKYVLCAAYLASFNPARTDATFFMRASDKKKRKKKGNSAGGRPAKHRKIARRHLPPSPFRLDRLLAILHAILPSPYTASSTMSDPQLRTADILTSIATLTSLRLLLRSGAGAGAGDVLEASAATWRVNVGFEEVVRLGRSVGFEVQDFLAE